ncbi:MAG: metal-sensing transcriptional repressor [Anaeromicrobium sp.]|jgi:DNA-binding FrmR family transcriptional regulator|uniref:metal-sensing transcriptional repressor n=1 Tax=Anaeromicrobium sp. TaxID=1929132 RepID=UPI0025E754B2|nr:metal-sensing transcriptional repressor [Anaeromicrobium sp.]MCT4593758.1 metal-sensing transcriptional repressor [Anaeromicrobium sp.]
MECNNCSGERKVNYRDKEIEKKLVTRLNKVEGQIRGIKGMIEREIYCDDILVQISAVQSAMKSISKILFENHVKTCILDKMKDDEEVAVEELLKSINRMMK